MIDINPFDKIVSIHAPAWGATLATKFHTPENIGFNPRPRMGGDKDEINFALKMEVSIHAPAWGAT